jgi:hypothetical protein
MHPDLLFQVSGLQKLFRIHPPVVNCNMMKLVSALSCCATTDFSMLFESEKSRRLKPLQENVLQGGQHFCRSGPDKFLQPEGGHNTWYKFLAEVLERTDVKLPAIAYFRHRLANVVGFLGHRRCTGLPTWKREAMTRCRPAQGMKAAI